MLKQFAVENFKNFKKEIVIDFDKVGGYQFSLDCVNNETISKMLIYGRNATGKTNLGKALMDVVDTVIRLPMRSRGVFLNADSENNEATFSYVFQFDEDRVKYKYSKVSENYLSREQLLINDILIYRCDFVNEEFDFRNLSYIGVETINTDRYVQSFYQNNESETIKNKISFLRWIINNAALNFNSVLIKMADYLNGMYMCTVSNSFLIGPKGFNDRFFEILEKQDKVKDMEDFFNAMGLECKLVLKKLPDETRELYFKKEKKLLPFFETASSGTLTMFNFYRRFMSQNYEVSLMYLDEFDAFYHYEMAERLVKFFKVKYPNTQIIMTSHNTNLMMNSLMRPDCLFILSRDGRLTALCDATSRELREGHNLEKMYISGEFDRYE